MALLGLILALLGVSWGLLGLMLGLLGLILGLLGRSWALLGRSWGASGEPLGPPPRSLILAPFWDPPELKKQGFRVEGVSFFDKSKGYGKTP